MGHEQGEWLACRVTPGEGADREPVASMAEERWGPLSGERGALSQGRHAARLAPGWTLITLIRRPMQPRLMRLWDRRMVRQRFLIATSNDQRKNLSQSEHSRHRSLTGCMGNLVGGLMA